MGILLGVYYLLLEREKMHRFNRYYLLFSIVFSLALPLVIIPIYVEAEIVPEMMYNTQPVTPNVVTPITKTINYFPIVLWSLYGLITTLLLLRYISNIATFKRKASLGTVISYDNAKLVLIEEKVLPHTFLNYIFINREDYEQRTIEAELFTHELTHVRQKHTLDILFIEILKTIFWFNPFLYLYGRSIRLNHEFLADEKVVKTTQNVISYQTILLEKTSGTTIAFASNLTFSLTKKRLLMMTKTTTRTKAILLKTAVAPILIILLALLCTEEIAAQQNDSFKNIPANDTQRMQVYIVTQSQVDSLKKIDPVKYKDINTKDYFYLKTTYTENGKTAIQKSFKLKPSQMELTKLSDSVKEANTIDPLRIRKIEYIKIEGEELAKFRQDMPLLFKDAKAKYQKKIVTYVAEDGSLKVKTTFENIDKKTTSLPINVGSLEPPYEIEQVSNGVQDSVYNTSKLAKQPEYSDGGIRGFYNYVNSNFKIPTVKEDMTARIYVSFVIEKDGSITNVKILRSPNDELSAEAIRVLRNTDKKWIPGETADGKIVRASYNLPITINIKP